MTSENPDLTLRFESQNIPHRHQGLCPYHTKPPIPPQLTSMPMRQGVYAPQAEPRILKAPPHCQRRSQLLNASVIATSFSDDIPEATVVTASLFSFHTHSVFISSLQRFVYLFFPELAPSK